MKQIFSMITLGLAALAAQAQTQPQYAITWSAITGGGGVTSNSSFILQGSIGQPLAGGPLTGGNFSLTAGFWGVAVVQTPGAPLLMISPAGNNTVTLSWPSPSTGFVLQQSATLNSSSWTNVLASPADDGVNKRVTILGGGGQMFFRLKN